MAIGIEAVESALKSIVDLVNAEESFRKADFKLIGQQILDADEAELKQLVEVVKKLDLNNDALELKIKELSASGAPMVAFVLRMIKVFFPKQP